MNEIQKTSIFVAAAVLIAGGATLWRPDLGRSASDFRDQGERFFPKFDDPLAATDLEVVDFDAATARPLPFEVKKANGKWVIPSHYNYPADGKDRLSKTAAGVIDLKKDTIRSDRPDEHAKMGVVDPLDTKLPPEGRGKRVTLKDASGAVLADFIIGKEVVGHPEQRYVRVPDKNRTYGVRVNVDLSTKFADWIETNLLKVEPSRVRKVVFDSLKADPVTGNIDPGEQLVIDRSGPSATWTTAGLPANKELDADRLSSMSRQLGDLKIVGVRPKPAGLTRELKATDDEGIRLSPASVRSLGTRGFYLVQGKLLSNQGEVRVATDEGVAYTLRFGELTYATGEELSAGTAEEPPADASKKDKKKKDGPGESRFLFVTAQLEPSMIPEPKPEPPPSQTLPGIFSDPFARQPDDPKRVAEAKTEQEKADKAKAEYDRKIADANKRVKELTDRFAEWYYVVSGEAFRELSLNRMVLVRDKTAKPPAMPPGMSFPGGGGLPPGFQLPGR